MAAESDTDAGRRVLDQLGAAYRIPILNVREGDVGVLLGPPIAGLFLGTVAGGVFVLPATLAGLLVGATLVAAAPEHLTAWDWLRAVARYYLLRPRYTLSRPADASHDGTEGGAAAYVPFTPDERTQDLTAIRRAWPGAGVVEREDGAMEAFLEIEPANMDFAMSTDWETVQTAGETFANTELTFPLRLHATTEPFPADRVVAQLDERLDDEVALTSTLAALVEEYRERRPAELADTHQHRYYLGVTVRPAAVARHRDGAQTPVERLAAVPVLGAVLGPFVARRGGAAAERRQAMFERLDERVRTVRTEFVEDVPGWSATRLSTLELVVLAAGFWQGESFDPEDADRLLREEQALHAREGGDRP